MRAELLARVKELPGIFHAIAEQLQSGGPRAAMEYYATFITQALPKAASQTAADLLPTLQQICTADLSAEPESDTSASLASSQTHDRAEQAPLTDTATSPGENEPAQEAHGLAEDPSSTNKPVEISWDVDMAAEDDQPAEAPGTAEIDWDVDMTAGAGAGEPAGAPQIDWGIDVDALAPDAGPQTVPDQTGSSCQQPMWPSKECLPALKFHDIMQVLKDVMWPAESHPVGISFEYIWARSCQSRKGCISCRWDSVPALVRRCSARLSVGRAV